MMSKNRGEDMENFSLSSLPITIQQKTDEHYIVSGRLVAFDSPGPWDGYVFTEQTQFAFPHQKNNILAIPDAPVMYDHGYDPIIGVEPIGQLIAEGTQKKKDGIWIQSQIKRSEAYNEELEELIERGHMGLSSGGATHTAQAKKDGKNVLIQKWPIVECTITPIPANPATKNLAILQGNALQSRWLERNPVNNSRTKVQQTLLDARKMRNNLAIQRLQGVSRGRNQ